MRNIFLIITFLSVSTYVCAQSDSLPIVACPVDLMPTFPGGQAALANYIKDNLNYPEKEKKKESLANASSDLLLKKIEA